MKYVILVFATVFIFTSLCAQNMGIGITTPHQSAALDVTSNSGGILIPRMSSFNGQA